MAELKPRETVWPPPSRSRALIPQVVHQGAQVISRDRAKAISWEPHIASMGSGLPRAPERNPVMDIYVGWLAEGLARATIRVHDGDGQLKKRHRIEKLFRHPVGGRGPFWRLIAEDFVYDGIWLMRSFRSPGGFPRKMQALHKSKTRLPFAKNRDRGLPVWHYTKPGGESDSLLAADVVYGCWNFDPNNDFDGISPVAGLEDVLRMWWATIMYEVDAFLRSGGVGLLVTDPSLADGARFENDEQRQAYRVAVRDTWRKATQGGNRGDPIVTDGETKVESFGVGLSDLDMHIRRAELNELILGRVQLPPAAAGLRIERDPTYANSRTWESVAYERALLPRMRDIADVLSVALLTTEELEDGFEVVFDTPDALRAALEDRIIHERIILNRLEKGAASVKETRMELEGLVPDEELERDLQQAHIIRLFGIALQVPVEGQGLSDVLGRAIQVGEEVATTEALSVRPLDEGGNVQPQNIGSVDRPAPREQEST